MLELRNIVILNFSSTDLRDLHYMNFELAQLELIVRVLIDRSQPRFPCDILLIVLDSSIGGNIDSA